MSPQRHYTTVHMTDTTSPWTEPYHITLANSSSTSDETPTQYNEENQPTHDALTAIYNFD